VANQVNHGLRQAALIITETAGPPKAGMRRSVAAWSCLERYSDGVSKAFTKEDDDAPVAPPRKRGAPVPEPNFVTAKGLEAARAELDELLRTSGDPDRIRELSDHLATAQTVEPADRNAVGLGASVTVEDEAGKRTTYRIVGAIEADTKRGWLSWQTPIANALWDAHVGDSVELPRGGEVEIVAIDYE
jgi:transcription elongation factor GreB